MSRLTTQAHRAAEGVRKSLNINTLHRFLGRGIQRKAMTLFPPTYRLRLDNHRAPAADMARRA
jgi:hypothetical protein